MQQLDEILKANRFEETEEICPGCQNHCQVRCYHFANGKSYFSGNNCERVYSNSNENSRKGVNMFDEKYKMLFEHRPAAPDRIQTAGADRVQTIGIPRGLGIY